MKEIWTITKEDAEFMCIFLQKGIDSYLKAGNIEQGELESLQNVHAALIWADRIEIED